MLTAISLRWRAANAILQYSPPHDRVRELGEFRLALTTAVAVWLVLLAPFLADLG